MAQKELEEVKFGDLFSVINHDGDLCEDSVPLLCRATCESAAKHMPGQLYFPGEDIFIIQILH